jgi:hypothetical protein
MKLYNNTFYNTGTIGDTPSSGALTDDLAVRPNQVDIRNNIFWPHPGSGYNRGAGNPEFAGGIGIIANNLWYGGKGANPATTFSAGSLQADPRFVATTPGAEDLHLQAGSPALDAGTEAVSGIVTSDCDIVRPASLRTAARNASAFHVGAYSGR